MEGRNSQKINSRKTTCFKARLGKGDLDPMPSLSMRKLKDRERLNHDDTASLVRNKLRTQSTNWHSFLSTATLILTLMSKRKKKLSKLYLV